MTNLSGQTIKGYKMRELIGLGGFGSVYRAYQEVVDREVAIKVIHSQYANQPRFIRSFEYEAKLIARLEHVYIVPLYDFWRDPTGAYIVMRLLKGGSLQDLVRRDGPLAPERAAHVLDQVAQALAAAHKHGVVHQDIKTANILLDEDGNAFLSDFGISKDLSEPREPAPGDEPGEVVLHGSPEYMAPEQILRAGSDARTDIYSLGIVLFEILTGVKPFVSVNDEELIRKQLYDKVPRLQEFRAELPEALNVVIQRATDKAPRQRYANALMMAENLRQFVEIARRGDETQEVAAVKVEASELHLDESLFFDPPNPYKGLRAFQETDAQDFFGRDQLIERLYQRSRGEARFLAVVGPSGSGKSSVVRAGLLPKLRQHSADWFIATMTPGSHPLRELEAVLISVAQNDESQFAPLLLDGITGIERAVDAALGDFLSELVLFIDQFEEVFTLIDDETERMHFINSLVHAMQAPNSRLRVIVTLRADFYDRPLMYGNLGRLLQQRTEIVLPMGPEELTQAIVKPAERVGLKLEPGLVNEILNDISGQPASLPLLQFALTELYSSRKGNALTHKAYTDSGGVSGAMTRRADEIFMMLSPESKEAAKQLFLRLVTPGDGTEDTRRRVFLSELLSIEGDSRLLQQVTELFGKRRLLSFDNDPTTRMPTVEIAHEALIRNWKQLRTWLNQNRDSLRLHRQLALATREWANAQRDRSYLASGARLIQFESLLESKLVSLNRDEREYLDSSISRRQRESQLKGIGIAVLSIIAVLGVALAVFAFDRERRAIENGNLARSRELSITALTNGSQLDIAALLSETAVRVANTFDARSTMLKILQSGFSNSAHLVTFLHGQNAEIRAVAVSPDGRLIATGDSLGHVRFWDAITYRPVEVTEVVHAGEVNTVKFSPDGRTLASAGDDRVILLTDVRSGTRERLEGHADGIWALAFHPDGTLLASASEDDTVRLWNLTSGESRELRRFADDVFAVSFHPQGTMLAVGGADSLVTLWDPLTGEAIGQPLTGHQNWVRALAFNPSGALLASGGSDTNILLWQTSGGTPIGALSGHTAAVRDLAFVSGATLASGGDEGTINLWNVGQGAVIDQIGNLQGRPVRTLATSADGRYLFVGGTARAASVWDLSTTRRLGTGNISDHQTTIHELWTTPLHVLTLGVTPDGAALSVIRRSADTLDVIDELVLASDVPSNYAAYAVSPDGRVLALGTLSGQIELFSLSDGARITTLTRNVEGAIFALAFSPDGRRLAAGDQTSTGATDGGVQLFEQTDVGWQAIGERVSAHPDRVMALTFSTNGHLLATGGRDASIRLWDVPGLTPSGPAFEGHTAAVIALAFAPDDLTLVSGGRDNLILRWSRENPARIQRLQGHVNWVTDLDFNGDGSLLSSAGRDNSLLLWDLTEGEPRLLGNPFVHAGPVAATAFAPDGRTVIAAAEINQATEVVKWHIELSLWETVACRLANRTFTEDERSRYLQGNEGIALCGDQAGS